MDIIVWIQNWYKNNCDGDWEHMYGIEIDTLDNPGWKVSIDLLDTPLETKVFDMIQNYYDDNNWIYCMVKDGVFYGSGDTDKFKEILIIFKNWVEN